MEDKKRKSYVYLYLLGMIIVISFFVYIFLNVETIKGKNACEQCELRTNNLCRPDVKYMVNLNNIGFKEFNETQFNEIINEIIK